MSFERVRICWLGQVPYNAALETQERCRLAIGKGQANIRNSDAIVLGLEHPSVITLGRRGDRFKDLRISDGERERLGIDLVNIGRGGQATLHTPGQLVIYPIAPLREWGLGVREFVELLQETTRLCLQSFGLSAEPCSSKEPGLYTSAGKIAFFGIQVSGGVSHHGIAINVSNDLGIFRHIRSCGVEAETFDRVARVRPELAASEVFEAWSEEFLRSFAKTSFSLTPVWDLTTVGSPLEL